MAQQVDQIPVQLEAGSWSIDQLMRYGMAAAGEIGVEVSPSKMSKVIRRAIRCGGGTLFTAQAIDRFLECRSWAGFEMFVNGYADPTGATAAQRVDNTRRGAGATRSRDAT